MSEESLEGLFGLVHGRDKMILIAYYLVGWSHAEIGKELGITRERVRQIRVRAIKRLRIVDDRLRELYSIHRLLYRARKLGS